jgi:hypothetical protein
MADYSPEDASRAELIVSQLLQAEADPEREGRVELQVQPENLVLFDVQSIIRQFTADTRLLTYFGADVPALEFVGQSVPVSLNYALGQFAGLVWWSPPFTSVPVWRIDQNYRDYLYFTLTRLRVEPGFLEFAWLKLEEAQNVFRTRTIDFVATRIAGLRYFSEIPTFLQLPRLFGGSPTPTPGCNFTVTTNTNGLRVFWSGASYIVPSYFSHPTSPASSVLQSGNYVFGVDGGAYGNNIQWDRNAAITLPGSKTQVHLNY